jgi:hypothetical protein
LLFPGRAQPGLAVLVVEMHHRFKSSKRLLIIAASATAVAAVLCVLVVAVVARPKPPVGGQPVLKAVQRFSRGRRPLPTTVTFSQLIAEGYLGSNVLSDYGALEVTVNLHASESTPRMFLMDALMPDGSHTVLLSDGSVQGFGKSRFPQAASNGGPVVQPSSAEGSGEGRPR